MKRLLHLQLDDFTISSGSEWQDASPAWRFLTIRSGAAYSLGMPQAREFAPGELLVAAPKQPVLVRASVLGNVAAAGFSFCPDLMCGFLTLQERLQLEKPSKGGGLLRFLPSTHPSASALAGLLDAKGGGRDLRGRIGALGIVATVLADELRVNPGSLAGPQKSAEERFHELVDRMPDGEFINLRPKELARLCGCSPRHFGRLFNEVFGVSARERQTELRLLRARQLLGDSDAKIVQVALDCGYRNLSQFNSLFKRKFRMTPTEWRKKSSRILGRTIVLAAMAFQCITSKPARGAEATNAAPPVAVSTNAGPVFEVQGYFLDGNTVLPKSVFDPVLLPHTGPAVSFEEIRKALAALQLAYRERGYITVSVSLPPQQLTNGIVTLKVTEGTLSDVRVVGNRYFSTENVLRALPSVQTNDVLNGLEFQQDLDRANANRDRQIYPVISPGPDPGTSALELRVKDRPPYHGRVEVNNYATPNSPDVRLDLSAVANNLWQLEHQFGIQYGFSPTELKEGNYAFYDKPLIANYSTFYRIPLGTPARSHPDGTAPTFGYDEAARRFVPPPVLGSGELLFYASRSFSDTAEQLQSETLTPPEVPPEGTLQVSDRIYSRILNPTADIGFRMTKPILDVAAWKVNVSLGTDFKRYSATQIQNRVFQATVFVPTTGSSGPPFTEFSSPPTSTSRTIETSAQYFPLSLGLNASHTDASGTTLLTLNQSINAFLPSTTVAEYQAAVGSTNATGTYYIVSAGVTREQKLWHEWGVRLAVDGQWANEPLISTEQYGLGGVAGVRGYRPGQIYGDSGWRAMFEPHTSWHNIGMVDNTAPFMVRFYGFLDYGQTYLSDPGARQSPVSLCGTGCGMDATIGSHIESKIMFGVPLLSVPGRDAGAYLFQFSLGVQF
jgi:hemolysin activation/secretion protein/AraC-like DNA-binding protein